MNFKRLSSLGLITSSAGLLLMAQSSCSVVVNDFKQQCETTQDCVELAARQPLGSDGKPLVSGVGLVCSDKHVCVQSGCRTNKECTAANGEASLCRPSDLTCQKLRLPNPDDPTAPVCDILADEDDIANENTVWIGASVIFAPGTWQGLEMVRQDFKFANGLPPANASSKDQRPLAFVYCEADPSLKEGVNHLVNDLELPAVITSVGTSAEIDVLNTYSIPHNVFQLSTSAGGPILKSVDNKGLLLDLVLINENYHKETTELVKTHYLPLLRQPGGPLMPTELPRVAVISSFTPTAQTTAASIVTTLGASGTASNPQSFLYGNDDEPSGNPAAYASVVAKVLEYKPHVIIILGDDEIGPAADDTGNLISEGIDVPIEAQGATAVPGQPKPQWLGILGSVGQLPKDIRTLPDAASQLDWGSRSLYIQQHYDFEGAYFQNYIQQLMNIVGEDPNDVIATEGTSPYNEFMREGAYLTAYSIALLAAQGLELTGTNLAKAAHSFGSQYPGKFTVGRADIFPALTAIASTKRPFLLENFQGWIGFDDGGFAKYEFADDVACLKPDTDPMTNMPTVGDLTATGGIFETTGTLTGTVSLSTCVTK